VGFVTPATVSPLDAPLPLRVQRFHETLAVERDPVLDRLPELYTDDVPTGVVSPFRPLQALHGGLVRALFL
jgi:hypothetical protein